MARKTFWTGLGGLLLGSALAGGVLLMAPKKADAPAKLDYVDSLLSPAKTAEVYQTLSLTNETRDFMAEFEKSAAEARLSFEKDKKERLEKIALDNEGKINLVCVFGKLIFVEPKTGAELTNMVAKLCDTQTSQPLLGELQYQQADLLEAYPRLYILGAERFAVESFSNFFDKAKKYYETGDMTNAIIWARRAEIQNINSFAVHFTTGRASKRKEDLEFRQGLCDMKRAIDESDIYKKLVAEEQKLWNEDFARQERKTCYPVEIKRFVYSEK